MDGPAKGKLSEDVSFLAPPAGSGATPARVYVGKGGVVPWAATEDTALPPLVPEEQRGLRLRLMAQQAPLPELPEAVATHGDVLYESVLERNNLLPAWFLELGVERARAVCKLSADGVDFRGRPGQWVGTGFLVAPDILLTNHHVLNTREVAAAAKCTFNYQLDAEGNTLPTKTFRLDPARLFLTSPAAGGLDLTFVGVQGRPGDEFGIVPLDRSSFKVVRGEYANIIQHPDGEPKQVCIQENQIVQDDLLLVHYASDTLGGSSGSPVFNNEWQLIALHHATRRAEAVGLVDAANTGRFLNEGIKISAIAAYLEGLLSDHAQVEAARRLLGLFSGSDAYSGFFGTCGRKPRAAGADAQFESVVDSYRGELADVDIGFWNIEHFYRRIDEKLDDVAKALVEMNVDIWAFEESSLKAAERLADHLRSHYSLDYGFAAADPAASAGRMGTTLLWNRATVQGKAVAWPAECEPWFRVKSQNFDELVFETVDGRVFDRYPGLFRFRAERPHGDPFEFQLVALHLKAFGEGEKRRRMAAQILGAAIRKAVAAGYGDEWVVGGDFNARLATEDFARLLDGGLVPLSAADEQAGAFSYIKGTKSLIDHIFLSSNLASTYGAAGFFVVAAERSFPQYLKRVSDHRPVLVRLSLNDQPTPPGEGPGEALPESLIEALRPLGASLPSRGPAPSKA